MKKLALLLTTLVAVSPAFSTTYAVCMGVNDYPAPLDASGKPLKGPDGKEISNDLKGAVNDATNMKGMLVSHYGVANSNVKIYTDKTATVAGFLEGMKWAIGNLKPGDQLVFTFSGHGTQIPSETEEDKIDEGIVMADGQVIPDDVFGEVATGLRKIGVNSTFIFDSCFSGGMSRDFKLRAVDFKNLGSKGKFIPKTRINPTLSAIRLKQDDTQPSVGESAFIFASQEDTPSIDFPGTDEIPPQGLFTLMLLAVIEEEDKMPAGDLIEGIAVFFDETFKDMREKIAQKPSAEFSSPARARKPIIL